MLEITTKVKTGELKLSFDGDKIIGTLDSIFEEKEGEIINYKRQKVIDFGTIEYQGEKTNAMVPIEGREDIENFVEKVEAEKEKRKEKERQKELHFKVIETSNSGAWVTQDLLLEKEDKLLSDEQREKVRELESILGKQQRFAGASKEIKAEELPVEKGEIYTLEEIIELCKQHSESWKRKKEVEKEKEKHYQKCLQEAKETGKNVKLNSYSVECNDPDKECNLDIITVYVTPSGRKRQERVHTY